MGVRQLKSPLLVFYTGLFFIFAVLLKVLLVNFNICCKLECSEFNRATTRTHSSRVFYFNPAKYVVDELLEYDAVKNMCPVSGSGIVVIVNTARSHYNYRQIIRRTWGSLLQYKGFWVRVVFLLGQSDKCISRHKWSNNIGEHYDVIEEQLTYEDVVIGGFADTYRNMTYKHLMGYKYVLDNCPTAKYIVKTDDDVFVDVPQIIDEKEDTRSQNYDLLCDERADEPVRCESCPIDVSKWYVTEEEWHEDNYPEYCLGADYVINMEWMRHIYRFKNHGGFFWIDDVFVTGKLRKIAELKLEMKSSVKNISNSVTNLRVGKDFLKTSCKNETVNLGLFVLLNRDWGNFEQLMNCLWKKAEERSRHMEDLFFLH